VGDRSVKAALPPATAFVLYPERKEIRRQVQSKRPELELNQSKAEAKAKGEGRVEAERSAGRAGGDGDASLARCAPTHSAQVELLLPICFAEEFLGARAV